MGSVRQQQRRPEARGPAAAPDRRAAGPARTAPSPRHGFAPVSPRHGLAPPNGLPEPLMSSIEAMSGFAMDDVRVHRNSSEPAKLGALAYTQGAEIHLGAGQDKHLPHEAWHVVQQKQGRVRATLQMKGISINDDSALEDEADRMGAASIGMNGASSCASPAQGNVQSEARRVIQCVVMDESGKKEFASIESLIKRLQEYLGYRLNAAEIDWVKHNFHSPEERYPFASVASVMKRNPAGPEGAAAGGPQPSKSKKLMEQLANARAAKAEDRANRAEATIADARSAGDRARAKAKAAKLPRAASAAAARDEREEKRPSLKAEGFSFEYDKHGNKHFGGSGTQWTHLKGKTSVVYKSTEINPILESVVENYSKDILEYKDYKEAVSKFYIDETIKYDIGTSNSGKRINTFTIQVDVSWSTKKVGYHGYPNEHSNNEIRKVQSAASAAAAASGVEA